MAYDHWFDVVRLLMDIKEGKRDVEIPIVDCSSRVVGHLEPIGQRHIGDEALVAQFVRWRNQNVSGNLDQREATIDATVQWLIDVATNPTRIAFLMHSDGKLVGRCGSVEMRPWELMSDSLVRGERGGGIHFVHYAQVAAITWTYCALGIQVIHSKILSTNDAAFESCRRLGYDMRAYRSSPMYVRTTDTGSVLEEYGNPEHLAPGITLDYYQLKQAAFFHVVKQSPAFEALHAQICVEWPKSST